MISIVIPLYNEVENAALYPEKLFPVAESIVRQFNETCEFVLVDDGSRDATLQILHELKTNHSNVTVVPHGANKGMGAAIKTGFAHCKGDLVMTMDSDLTYRPQDIEKLLLAYKESNVDCVSGSPYRKKDLASDISSPFRLFMSGSVNSLYRFLLKNDLTCVSGIFRLYKKAALDELNLKSNNFEINAEIISKLILNGKTVREIGVKLYEREFGQSKLNVRKEILNNLKILYKIFKSRYLKKKWE
jgi:dolichol-phosphate mannosyltransferase